MTFWSNLGKADFLFFVLAQNYINTIFSVCNIVRNLNFNFQRHSMLVQSVYSQPTIFAPGPRFQYGRWRASSTTRAFPVYMPVNVLKIGDL